MKFLIAIVICMAAALPVSAQTSTEEIPLRYATWHGALTPEPKPTFKDKHPKIYKGFVKVRKICIHMQPLLNAAGSIAQIITAGR